MDGVSTSALADSRVLSTEILIYWGLFYTIIVLLDRLIESFLQNRLVRTCQE